MNFTEALNPDDAPAILRAMTQDLPAAGVLTDINDDDCAVLHIGDGVLVLTTDFLNASPVAFELGVGTWHDLGRLVVAASLADLCGSGAAPKALLFGACLPRDAPQATFEELAKGVLYEADRWSVPLVGGDTKLGPTRSLFAVAIGTASSADSLFLKKRAEPGDMLWVSGPIGGCAAAIVGLNRGHMGPAWDEWAARAITDPQLPMRQSRLTADAGLGKGGTDISDGLALDLGRLCTASQVGATVDAAAIPMAPQVRQLAQAQGVPDFALTFGVGGDFQFLVTTDSQAAPRMEQFGLTAIGQINPDPPILVRLPSGAERLLPAAGHTDHRRTSFAEEMTDLLAVWSQDAS